MLKTMRQCASNLFIKILLSIIVLALIWGFSDFSGRSSSEYVASIDNKYHITRVEFTQAKNLEINKFKNFLGELSDEQLQTLNIDGFVLKKLISKKLIEAETNDLKLYVSDKTAVKRIRDDQIFFGNDNKFDSEKFHKLLNSNNIIESKYLELLKNEISAKYLISAILGQNINFKNIATYLNKFDNQKRVIDLISIDPEKVKLDEIIKIDELKNYYDEHQNEFKIPSRRLISIVKFNKDSFSNDIIVSNKEINDYYESNKNDFIEDEKRDIYNFTFKTKKEADKFYDQLISGGIDLKKQKKSLLKNVSKNDLPLNLQEVAFSLDQGKFSEALKSDFGYNILAIDDISLHHQAKLDDVYQDIFKILFINKSDEMLDIKIKEIEDEVAAGSTISDISKNYNLKSNKLINLSQEDLVKNNDLGKFPNLVKMLLNNDVGFVSSVFNDENGNYIIFSIDDITDEKIKNFEDVKNQIDVKLIRLKKEEIARNILKKLKDNINEAKLPSQANLSQISLVYNKRNEFKDFVNDDLFEEIYNLNKGNFSNVFNFNGSLVIAHLKEIKNSDNDTNSDRALNELKEDSISLITDEYIAYLNKKHKVKIYN